MSDHVVLIRWHDASQYAGYHDQDDIVEILEGNGALMTSIGWFVTEDEQYVIIAQTRNLYKWGDVLRIPTACIRERTIIDSVPRQVGLSVPQPTTDHAYPCPICDAAEYDRRQQERAS